MSGKLLLLFLVCSQLFGHDASGRSSAPVESRRLVNPISRSENVLFEASAIFAQKCVSCHGEDGKSKTKQASTLPNRPTDLTNYFMQGMKDGEIDWILTNGDPKGMPGFASQLTDAQRRTRPVGARTPHPSVRRRANPARYL
jgi:cytochrome c553